MKKAYPGSSGLQIIVGVGDGPLLECLLGRLLAILRTTSAITAGEGTYPRHFASSQLPGVIVANHFFYFKLTHWPSLFDCWAASITCCM